MYNLTKKQLSEVKKRAIEELLEIAKNRNMSINSSMIELNEPDRVIPFYTVSVAQCNAYMRSLQEDSLVVQGI